MAPFVHNGRITAKIVKGDQARKYLSRPSRASRAGNEKPAPGPARVFALRFLVIRDLMQRTVTPCILARADICIFLVEGLVGWEEIYALGTVVGVQAL